MLAVPTMRRASLADVTFRRASLGGTTLSASSALETRLSSLERHLNTLIRWHTGAGAHAASNVITEDLIGDKESGIHIETTETAPERITIAAPSAEPIKSPEPVNNVLSVLLEEQDLEDENEQCLPVPTIVLERESEPDVAPSTQLASDILDVIQRYGQHLQASDAPSADGWIGKSMFFAAVEKQVLLDEPIRMILPAFPWKSINHIEKVTGALPDLGEVLALSRLNNLCSDIEKVYPKGAELTIATDGLVFDDLVGIPDEETWDYSESLMDIVAKRGFTSIKLLRAMDLLKLTDDQTMTKDVYLALTAASRTALETQYGRSEAEVRDMMKNDEDTLSTYKGFIRFLETDLKHSPIAQNSTSGSHFRRCVKKVAMGMMTRAESFTKLIQATCTDYVRLSIHPSSGGVKLSIPLIPQGSGVFPKTPWHSTVAMGLDGSYRTVHAKDVKDTHTLVEHNGQPFYYRERSDLWDWNDEGVTFEPQYPSGILVRRQSRVAGPQTLTEPQLEKLRQLAKIQEAPVTIMGFTNAADLEVIAAT